MINKLTKLEIIQLQKEGRYEEIVSIVRRIPKVTKKMKKAKRKTKKQQKKKDYKKYLQSEHWKKFKEDYYIIFSKFAVPQCRVCFIKKGRSQLHLHHRNYNNLYNETFDDIICLCKTCHNKLHRYAKGNSEKQLEKALKRLLNNHKKYEQIMKDLDDKWLSNMY